MTFDEVKPLWFQLFQFKLCEFYVQEKVLSPDLFVFEIPLRPIIDQGRFKVQKRLKEVTIFRKVYSSRPFFIYMKYHFFFLTHPHPDPQPSILFCFVSRVCVFEVITIIFKNLFSLFLCRVFGPFLFFNFNFNFLFPVLFYFQFYFFMFYLFFHVFFSFLFWVFFPWLLGFLCFCLFFSFCFFGLVFQFSLFL